MSTPENKVKARVKLILKDHSAYWHMPVQTGLGSPALDFHVCYKGHYLAIETKAPGNKLTPRQELTRREIEAAGGKVIVVGERLLGPDDKGEDEDYKYSGEAELEAWLIGLLF